MALENSFRGLCKECEVDPDSIIKKLKKNKEQILPIILQTADIIKRKEENEQWVKHLLRNYLLTIKELPSSNILLFCKTLQRIDSSYYQPSVFRVLAEAVKRLPETNQQEYLNLIAKTINTIAIKAQKLKYDPSTIFRALSKAIERIPSTNQQVNIVIDCVFNMIKTKKLMDIPDFLTILDSAFESIPKKYLALYSEAFRELIQSKYDLLDTLKTLTNIFRYAPIQRNKSEFVNKVKEVFKKLKKLNISPFYAMVSGLIDPKDLDRALTKIKSKDFLKKIEEVKTGQRIDTDEHLAIAYALYKPDIDFSKFIELTKREINKDIPINLPKAEFSPEKVQTIDATEINREIINKHITQLSQLKPRQKLTDILNELIKLPKDYKRPIYNSIADTLHEYFKASLPFQSILKAINSEKNLWKILTPQLLKDLLRLHNGLFKTYKNQMAKLQIKGLKSTQNYASEEQIRNSKVEKTKKTALIKNIQTLKKIEKWIQDLATIKAIEDGHFDIERLKSRQINEQLQKLHEFYTDILLRHYNVETILNKQNINEIAQELSKVKQIVTTAQKDKFILIPSKSRIDVLKGFVSEDCTGWDDTNLSIDQLNVPQYINLRIHDSEGKWVGNVYLLYNEKTKDLLIDAIQTQTSLRIHPTKFVPRLLEAIKEMAKKADKPVKRILITSFPSYISNRLNIQNAVCKLTKNAERITIKKFLPISDHNTRFQSTDYGRFHVIYPEKPQER